MTGQHEYVDVELSEDQLADLDFYAGRFGLNRDQMLEWAVEKLLSEADGRSLDPPE